MDKKIDDSYVATGEVTTLEHEIRDDTVEDGVLVAKALLASAEGTEVLGGLGNDIAKEFKLNSANGSYIVSQVKVGFSQLAKHANLGSATLD